MSVRKIAAYLALGASLGISAAWAQTTTSPAPVPAAPATAAAPVVGANSFTESQATERLTTAGYSGISGLRKDDQGVWRGSATKAGKTVAVSVDFKGNVVEAP